MRYLRIKACSDCPFAATSARKPYCKKAMQTMDDFDGIPEFCPLITEEPKAQKKKTAEEILGGPADPARKPIDPDTVKVKTEGKAQAGTNIPKTKLAPGLTEGKIPKK